MIQFEECKPLNGRNSICVFPFPFPSSSPGPPCLLFVLCRPSIKAKRRQQPLCDKVEELNFRITNSPIAHLSAHRPWLTLSRSFMAFKGDNVIKRVLLLLVQFTTSSSSSSWFIAEISFTVKCLIPSHVIENRLLPLRYQIITPPSPPWRMC